MIKSLRIILLVVVFVTFFSSCTILSSSKKGNDKVEISKPKNDYNKSNNSSSRAKERKSYITIDELLYNDEFNSNTVQNDRSVMIEKIDVLEKCSRNYFETQKYYKNGKLYFARIKFENILENLEYLYGDEKVSDSLMLDNLSNYHNDNNGDDSKPNNDEIDIFVLYNILFSDIDFRNVHIEDENNTTSTNNELMIENIDNSYNINNKRNSSLSIKQNNKEYLFIKEKVSKIINISQHSKTEFKKFVDNVYDTYRDYLQDKFFLQELYIRSSKYDSFIKTVIEKENLNNTFRFIPAIMSSYYTGKNSGGLWQLDNIREYRRSRNDVVASTAIVLEKIKKQQKLLKKKIGSSKEKNKRIISAIISIIVSERNYKFSRISDYLNNEKVLLNSDFSDFIALEIILNDPNIHGLSTLKVSDNSKKTKSYIKAYNDYKLNPKKYTKKSIKKSRKKIKKKSSSNKKSYVILKYKVRKGDFLQKIATLYKCSVKDIRKWNPKSTRGKNLHIGTTLYIRGYKFQAYKARRGDTIAKICSRRKMKMSNFMKINNLKKKTIYRGRTYYVKK